MMNRNRAGGRKPNLAVNKNVVVSARRLFAQADFERASRGGSSESRRGGNDYGGAQQHS